MINIIYKITNTINDKIYIGQTWKSLYKRFQIHCNKNSCIKLFRAITKYGKNNFTIKPLVYCEYQLQADQMEIFFISYFDSIKNGYNLRTGGSRGRHSEESKIKQSNKMKGRKLSEEHKNRISNSSKGEKNGNFGRKHTLKSLEKIKQSSIKQINRSKPPNHKGKTWKLVNGKRIWSNRE